MFALASAARTAAARAAPARPIGPAPALALILPLSGKTVGANIPKCRFHWVWLTGGCLPVTMVGRIRPLPSPPTRAKSRTLGPTQGIPGLLARARIRAARRRATATALAPSAGTRILATTAGSIRPLGGLTAVIPSALGAACRLHQGIDVCVVEFHPSAAFEAAWQDHRAVSDSDQTANGVTHGLEHTSHLPVTPLRDGDAVPAIGPLTTALLNRTKLSQAVVKLYTFQQALFFFLAQGAQNAYCVLPLESKSGVHQPVG
jgi:hypothetical protein